MTFPASTSPPVRYLYPLLPFVLPFVAVMDWYAHAFVADKTSLGKLRLSTWVVPR